MVSLLGTFLSGTYFKQSFFFSSVNTGANYAEGISGSNNDRETQSVVGLRMGGELVLIMDQMDTIERQ